MKISIITTTFNSEKTIRDTIESIINQTYTDYEYIIIDGASDDHTIDIVKEYEPILGNKLKWISEKDKGIYDAMNKGILLATGEIIGILNSDDFFSSNNILDTISKSFQNEKIDAIYGDVHFINDKNPNKIVRYYSSKIFRPYLMKYGMMPAHPSFYIRKKYFHKIGLYKTSYKIAADFEFLLRAIYIKRINTLYIEKDFVTMRVGGASTSGFASRKLIMKEHIRAFKENNIYTNPFLLSLRYFYRIYEVIYSKIIAFKIPTKV